MLLTGLSHRQQWRQQQAAPLLSLLEGLRAVIFAVLLLCAVAYGVYTAALWLFASVVAPVVLSLRGPLVWGMGLLGLWWVHPAAVAAIAMWLMWRYRKVCNSFTVLFRMTHLPISLPRQLGHPCDVDVDTTSESQLL